MKQIPIFVLTASALLLAACSESSYEYHNTYFYPQEPYGKVLYADQESDSTTLFSADDWTARSTAEWFTISPTSKTVPNGYSTSTRIDISTTANTGSSNRQGAIEVDAHDKIGMVVYQTTWLNIVNPAPRYEEDEAGSIEGRKASFIGTAAASATSYELKFTTYKNGATLSCDAPWITLPERSFSAGAHTVNLTLTANADETPRTATLTLASNGVSTPITLTQAGASEE